MIAKSGCGFLEDGHAQTKYRTGRRVEETSPAPARDLRQREFFMSTRVTRRNLFAAGALGAAAAAAHGASFDVAAQTRAEEHPMSQASVTSRTIAVEHIRISSERPFAE